MDERTTSTIEKTRVRKRTIRRHQAFVFSSHACVVHMYKKRQQMIIQVFSPTCPWVKRQKKILLKRAERQPAPPFILTGKMAYEIPRRRCPTTDLAASFWPHFRKFYCSETLWTWIRAHMHFSLRHMHFSLKLNDAYSLIGQLRKERVHSSCTSRESKGTQMGAAANALCPCKMTAATHIETGQPRNVQCTLVAF